jgi:hypothetical protein
MLVERRAHACSSAAAGALAPASPPVCGAVMVSALPGVHGLPERGVAWLDTVFACVSTLLSAVIRLDIGAPAALESTLAARACSCALTSAAIDCSAPACVRHHRAPHLHADRRHKRARRGRPALPICPDGALMVQVQCAWRVVWEWRQVGAGSNLAEQRRWMRSWPGRCWAD